MNTWGIIVITTLVSSVATIFASQGFWNFFARKSEIRSKGDVLLMGIAQGKIVSDGMDFLRRGWIIHDEYEDYRKLYEAYKALGGNGVTERVMAEVQNLPLRPRAMYAEVLQAAKTRSTESDQSLALIPAA